MGNVDRNLMTVLLVICILMLLSIPVASASEPEYSIDYVELIVYRDGLVHVTQALTVNETFPSISIRLLAPSIENILAVDENETVLDYEVEGSKITIFTLGARSVLLEYDDIISLTTKEAGVWTLILDNPCNLSVCLPEGSTIVYLSEVPTSIDTEDGRILLCLSDGEWEISYVLPIVKPPEFRVSDLVVSPTEVEVGEEITISATVTNIGEAEGAYTLLLKIDQVIENTKTVTLRGGASTTVEFKVVKEYAGTFSVEVAGLTSMFTVKEPPPPFPMEYVIGIVLFATIGSSFILLRRRTPTAQKIFREHPELRTEDREVIQFIAEMGGKVLEAEIRERFRELPRTTLWRLVRRLERMEIVTIKKVGLQNQIELRK